MFCVTHMWFSQAYILFYKIVQNYFIILFFYFILSKSNVEGSVEYWIIRINLVNICYYIFVPNKFFNFFWNTFFPKAIKLCCCVTIPIQWNPLSFYWLILIETAYMPLILGDVWQIISWTNAFEFKFIPEISLYLEVNQRTWQN